MEREERMKWENTQEEIELKKPLNTNGKQEYALFEGHQPECHSRLTTLGSTNEGTGDCTADMQNLENGLNQREMENEDGQRFRFFCIDREAVYKKRLVYTIAVLLLVVIVSVTCNIIKCGCGSGQPEDKKVQILTPNTTEQLKQSQTTALPSIMKCPPNWFQNEKMCYFFSDIQRSWNYSQRYCSSYGGSLLIIHSEQELAFVTKHKQRTEYWINLQRKTEEDPWMWPNGTFVDNWLYIGNSGLCAYLNENAASSTYCDNVRNWICSKPIYST